MLVAKAKTVRQQRFSIPQIVASSGFLACSLLAMSLVASEARAEGAFSRVVRSDLAEVSVSTGTQSGNRFVSDRSGRPLFEGPTLVTSGFSGTRPQSDDRGQSSQRNPHLFIDPEGATATLTAIDSLGSGYNGLEIKRRPYDQLLAKDTGQIFGLAIDDGDRPNLYLTATSAFGLPIVGRDRDRDGLADKLYTGRRDARFMEGLFGPNPDNAPGSVWKVDGRTGRVSLFASLELDGVPNSGPGLGNIAFDAQSKQLFVSDLDTGVIFRLDMDGHVLETFDHGVSARAQAGLRSVAFDPSNRLDITSPSFDVEDPDSWHFAAEKRRVWGLATYKRRLYYSVADGPEVWSVGIQRGDGAFSFDARKEFALPSGFSSFEISDIAFGPDGSAILAQRGDRVGSFDFTRIAKPRRADTVRVLRNRNGTWRKNAEGYAIGFAHQMRNGTGGVAMGPAYASDGRMDASSCKSVLWATGEHLRNRPQLASRLSQSGELDVAGVQAQPFGLSRDENNPPWFSYFLDFDAKYPNRTLDGQMGDVEVFGCPGIGVQGPVVTPSEPQVHLEQPKADLQIKKKTVGNCLVNRTRRTYSCDFLLTITNHGDGVFDGPVVLTDQFERPAPISAKLVDVKGWKCSKPKAGSFTCVNKRLIINPGRRILVKTRMLLPGQVRDARYYNCAMLGVGSSTRQKVTVAQIALELNGIASGGVDGRMGRNTRRGLQELQQRLGLSVTGEVSPELFQELGLPIADKAGLSCAPALLKAIPLPPVYEEPPVVEEPPITYPDRPIDLFCDRRTTVQRGNSCVCRYDRMRKVTQTQCACRNGRKFVRGQGCVRVREPVRCDPATTVQQGRSCECRYPNMRNDSALSCACRPGAKFVAGRGCVRVQQPVGCDPTTTVQKGKYCQCRYPNMRNNTSLSCVCKPGSAFVAGRGCVRVQQPVGCDPTTTVQKGKYCQCRYPNMRNNTSLSCACKRGSAFVAGRGCVQIQKPRVEKCDPRTSVARNGRCVCRFPYMHKTSPTACSCNPGRKFVRNKGCVPIKKKPVNQSLVCDPNTAAKQGKQCVCRYPGMRKTSATSCTCKPGQVLVQGQGCKAPVLQRPRNQLDN